jgi:hypothetical protein
MIGGNGNVIGGGTLGLVVLGGTIGRTVVGAPGTVIGGGTLGRGEVVRGADPRCASATVGNKTSATTIDARFICDRLRLQL